MEKIGLFIVNQLHEITQAGYNVQFEPFFRGMITIQYTAEFDKDFYEHVHVGMPIDEKDTDLSKLEKEIMKALNNFRQKHINKQ